MSDQRNKFWVVDPFNEIVAGFKTEKEALEYAKSEARMTPGCPFLVCRAYKKVATSPKVLVKEIET